MTTIKVKKKDSSKVFSILLKMGETFTGYTKNEYSVSNEALDRIEEAGIKVKFLTPREPLYPVKCYSCKVSDSKKKLYLFRHKGRIFYTCVDCSDD